MLSYIHFLLKTFSKRISSYILVAIHLVVVYIFLVTNIDNFVWKSRGISYLSSIDTFMKFFPFLFTSVFSILVVTHIFQGGANGVEIMIVAKPITRKQIVMSKFLVVFSLLLLHQVFIFISYSLFSLYDSGASSIVRANWAISLALGGFIVQTIFVFIIILMASLVGKMGTAIIGVVFSAVIPITSIIITSMSLAIVSVRRYQAYASYGSTLKINSEDNANDNRGLYLDRAYDYDLKKESYDYDSKRESSYTWLWNDYQKNKWYQDAYPFDIWYHWGRFMSLFTKDNVGANQPFIQNLKINDSTKINQNDVFLEIGKENDPNFPLMKYGLLLNVHKHKYKENLNNQFPNLLSNYFTKLMKPDSKIKSLKDLIAKIKERFKIHGFESKIVKIGKFNKASLFGRLSTIRFQIFKFMNVPSNPDDVPFQYELNKILAPVVYKILSQEKIIIDGREFHIENNKALAPFTPENEDEWHSYLKDFGLVRIYDNDKKNVLGYTISSRPYASTGAVVVIWLLIGTLLGGISIAIFFKKDFK